MPRSTWPERRQVTRTIQDAAKHDLIIAAIMSSFIFSDRRVLGRIGTTIGLGLLFDTLIVRSFMTPSIAALLGRWFWWPLNVRPRPASRMLRPYGSRTAARRLLEPEPEPEDAS